MPGNVTGGLILYQQICEPTSFQQIGGYVSDIHPIAKKWSDAHVCSFSFHLSSPLLSVT